MAKHEWLCFEMHAHSPRGTEIHRGVFPASNVTHIQVASVSATIAAFLEAWELLNAGQYVSLDISVSLSTTVELDATEAMLVEKYKKKRGADRFDRFFQPAAAYQGGSNGEGK